MSYFAKRKLSFALFLLFLSLIAITPAGAKESFVTGYVNDQAGLLRPEEERELSTLLADFDEKTTNQFIIITLPTLPPGESLEGFALKLAEGAKAGTAERDNGLLILILSEERKIRIEVGTGLEEKITDGRAGRVIREIIAPAFQEEAYFTGIKSAVLTFVNWVDTSYFPEGSEGAALRLEEENEPGFLFFVILFIIMFIFSAYTSRRQQRRLYKRGYSQRTMGPIFYPPVRSGNRSAGTFKGFGGGNFGGGSFRGGGGGFRGGGASGGW